MENAIIYLLSFLTEAIIIWQYTSSLFIAKRKPQIKLAVLCSLYFVLFAVSLFEVNWLNVILYFTINYIFLITQHNLKWYSALFHTLILTAIMGMCELMVYGIVKFFAPHFLENGRDFISLLIYGIFNKLMFFTITYILICFFRKKQRYPQQYDKSVFLLIFIPITSIFVMFTFVNIGENSYSSPSLNWMVTLSAIFLLAINLLVFGINQYNQKKNMEFTEMQLMIQKEATSAEYYEMLRLQNENQRILIHDIKNHLQSIDILNDKKEPEKVHAYIHQLLLSSDLKESSRLCDHTLLNMILCRYMQQCNNKHIAFHADIRNGTTDFIDDNDLTSLFCNLLDNAVEAADNIPDSFIEISTNKREHTPLVVITVINSCRTNPFSEHNGNLVTHKSNKHKHGFGLKSIQRNVNNYSGNMQMYYNEDTLTFHTIITLKAKGGTS